MRNALFAIFLAFTSTGAFAGDDWSFIFVSSGPSGYEVAQGKGTVLIEHGALTADVQSATGVRYKISGNIKKKDVSAKFSIVDSDYFTNSPFSGSYAIEHWSDLGDSKGREAISLTDGWNFIGLTHELR